MASCSPYISCSLAMSYSWLYALDLVSGSALAVASPAAPSRSRKRKRVRTDFEVPARVLRTLNTHCVISHATGSSSQCSKEIATSLLFICQSLSVRTENAVPGTAPHRIRWDADQKCCWPDFLLSDISTNLFFPVKMLGQKWSEMLDEEKRPFRDHEEQLRQQYHIDIKNYKKGTRSLRCAWSSTRSLLNWAHILISIIFFTIVKGAVPEEDYHGNIPIMKSQQVEPPRVQHSYHQELVYQNPVAQTQPEEDLGYRNFFATDM